MSNYTPNNQPNNQANKKPGQNPAQDSTQKSTQGNKQTVESAPTADKPTPVSASSQRQGSASNQSGSAPTTMEDAKQEVKQAGREITDEAKQAVSDATHEVKQQANELRHQAQDQASGFLNEQKDVAAQRVGSVAEALRQTGQEFADRDEGMLAHYTESLAGQLDNFSSSLRDREIGSLLDDARELAHRQPELFVAGALAAGFVLGRFFKSSRRRAYTDYPYQGSQYGQGYEGYSYGRFGDSYEGGYGRDYEGAYGGGYGASANRGGYGEYDPRNPARPYGEPYGQRYGDELSQNRGPYGSTFESGTSGGSQQSYAGRTFDQGSDQEYEQASRQARNDSTSSSAQGQVTTHGLGTGQSIQQQEDLQKGQEFGQGEEQVSNYKGNETQKASDFSKGPNQREEGQEGEIR
jgi:hypothetical protein